MEAGIRASYRVFPKWTQPFWTWVTGKALSSQSPLFKPSSWIYLSVALAVFIAGVIGSMLVIVTPEFSAFYLLLFIGMSLHGSRLLVLTVAHQCAHNMFCRDREMNSLVHDIITTLICSQDYVSYRHDHFVLHHGLKTFGTEEDPVFKLIRSTGFDGNRTKNQLWFRLLLTFFSPAFHFGFIRSRIKSNFLHANTRRKIFSWIWWGSIAIFLMVTPKYLLPFLVGYILPITFLYHISAFLELLCEHLWAMPIDQTAGFSPKQKNRLLCWGRFCGDPVPQGRAFTPWLKWWLRQLFYQLPCRLFVLTGDAPQHDYHHVKPNCRRWQASAYERQKAIDSGVYQAREIWSLVEAIDIVFNQVASSNQQSVDLDYMRTTNRI